MSKYKDKTQSETHPSYALVSFSRCSHAADRHMFGSSVPCASFIRCTVKSGRRERDLNNEWFFADDTLIEFELSPAQFADAITNMNVGDGVPCTLRYIKGENDNNKLRRDCPYEPKFDVYEREFKEECISVNSKILDAINKASEILEAKAVRKSDVREVQNLLSQIARDLTSNIPWVQAAFNEYLEKSVSDAKQEIAAFMTHQITNLGIEALQEKSGLTPITYEPNTTTNKNNETETE